MAHVINMAVKRSPIEKERRHGSLMSREILSPMQIKGKAPSYVSKGAASEIRNKKSLKQVRTCFTRFNSLLLHPTDRMNKWGFFSHPSTRKSRSRAV